MTELERRTVLGGIGGIAAAGALPALPVAAGHLGDEPSEALRTERLTTDHLVNPLGLDSPRPRFGWRLAGSGRDRAQSAYQILVATTPQQAASGHADVWGSGVVRSGEQTAIPYAGKELRPRTRYFWTVRAWDESGRCGPLATVAWFETALLADSDWHAEWIGTGITVPDPVSVLGPSASVGAPLTPGNTLGQSFVSTSPLAAIAVLLRVDKGEAGCTLTLRKDGPDGAVVGRQTASGLKPDGHGQAQARLDLSPPLAPGPLYLELSSPAGSLAWPSATYSDQFPDQYPQGTAFTNGAPNEDADRWVYGIPPDPPADPLLRKEFSLSDAVVGARLRIAGLGVSVAYVNGRRVGNAVLEPTTTEYDKRILYSTYDVTALLRKGANAIGVALGRGFFSTRAPDTDRSNVARWIAEPQVLAQLEITLADGQRVVVGSGPDWRLTEGPMIYDGVYTGETYDADIADRLAGWTSAGFDATGWRPAKIVTAPGGRLEASAVEPARAIRTVSPARISTPAPGVRLYDFGSVMTGWARVHGAWSKGTTVRMLYGEKLGADGRIPVGAGGGHENNSVTGRVQLDEYLAAGHTKETWEPSFTYKEFRYIEVSGPQLPESVVAAEVRNDVRVTAALRVDNLTLQWIADAVMRTTRNMLHGHPVLPYPSSKVAWLGANHWAAQPMLYGYGMAAIHAKWLEDIRLSQAASGELPFIAPQGEPGGPASQSSTGLYPHLVRRYWTTYGDPAAPARHFDAVSRYLGWLLSGLEDGIANDWFGDWYPPHIPRGDFPGGPEGGRLIGTAFVIQSLRDGVALAVLLGKTTLARAWRSRIAELVRRFNEEFLDTNAGIYRTERADVGYRQTSNALPLAFDLVPPEHVARVAANLAADVERKNRHFDTGNVGILALPYALTDNGHPELAHAVLTQQDYPSYGFLRGLGATTLWENWETTARAHNDPTNSSPYRWLVERVIGVEPLAPGWARFRVAPRAFGTLRNASLTLDTARGAITVAWKRVPEGIALDVTVPVNAIAEVSLPDGTHRGLGSGRHSLTSTL